MVGLISAHIPWNAISNLQLQRAYNILRSEIVLPSATSFTNICHRNSHWEIRKEKFLPGGMTPSEWTRSVRAITNTPVADYLAPSANALRHVAYCAPIAMSPFLPMLSICYIEPTHLHCGQLWPYVCMSSLATRLYRDCNGMGYAENISPHVPSTCVQNAVSSWLIILIIPSRPIQVAIDNPSLVPSVCCVTTWRYHWNYLRTADDGSHEENLQSNGCGYFSNVNKFQDRIQFTSVFRYCGERHCYSVLNESSVLIQELDFE